MADYVLEGPKWGGAAYGTAGGTVSWAVDASVPAGFVPVLQAAFAVWSSHANIQFQQVASTSQSQIDFSVGALDGSNGELGETSYSYSSHSFMSAAIEFDSGEGWHVSGASVVSADGVNLMEVALHEIGHSIGLDHYNAAPAVMNAILNPSVTDLTTSDVDGVEALYGAGTTANLFGTVYHDAHSVGGEVYTLYEGLLGRAPDPVGAEGWAAVLSGGASLTSVVQAFLASPEAQAHVGVASNAGYAEALYETVLGRQGDAAGLQGWTHALNTGTSRADVASSFLFSNEHIAELTPALNAGVFVADQAAAEVARLYDGVLRRAPDATGLQDWTVAVHSGTSLGSVAQAFIGSAEFAAEHPGGVTDQQFVDTLYAAALGRPADVVGKQSWLDVLAHGTSRADVAVGIAESAEAQAHLVPAIEQGWHLV